MIQGKFMTVGEAADVLQIDASLVTRYCRQGRLPAKAIGRQWLIDEAGLAKFAKEPRQVGNPNFGQPPAKRRTSRRGDRKT